MVGYSVRHRDLTFEIAIVETGNLLPHEEVMPAEVTRLSKRILEDGALHHPIIADRGSYTVLDGMHRLEAVKELGCGRILACFIDYLNPSITVRVWYRCFVNGFSAELMESLKGEKGLEQTTSSLSEVMKSLRSSKIDLAILADKNYVLRGEKSLDYVIDLVKQIEKKVDSPIKYQTEDEAIKSFIEGKARTVLCLRPILKDEVLSYAISRRLFPCKTTRHLIPARPIGVDVTLETLSDKEMTLESVNEDLVRSLGKRKARVLPPGTVVNGRKYEEELLSFCD